MHMPCTCTCLTSCTARYQAEAALAALGSSWDWLPGEMLRTVTKPMAALLTEARGGREVFFTAAESTFNQLADKADGTAAKAGGAATESGAAAAEVAAAPLRPLKAITYGDGAPLDAATKAALRDVAGFMERAQVAVPWQPGDALLCAAHTPPIPLPPTTRSTPLSPATHSAPPRPAPPCPLPTWLWAHCTTPTVCVCCVQRSIDNATVQHSREDFTPPRRILASLVGSLSKSKAGELREASDRGTPKVCPVAISPSSTMDQINHAELRALPRDNSCTLARAS